MTKISMRTHWCIRVDVPLGHRYGVLLEDLISLKDPRWGWTNYEFAGGAERWWGYNSPGDRAVSQTGDVYWRPRKGSNWYLVRGAPDAPRELSPHEDRRAPWGWSSGHAENAPTECPSGKLNRPWEHTT